MGRKEYIADLAACSALQYVENLVKVEAHEDGEFKIHIKGSQPGTVECVTVYTVDNSAYPQTEYMIFGGDDISEMTAAALKEMPAFSNMRLPTLVRKIIQSIVNHAQTHSDTEDNDGGVHLGTNMQSSSDQEKDAAEADSDLDMFSEEEDDDDDDDFAASLAESDLYTPSKPGFEATDALAVCLRNDLRAVKAAGFKVGVVEMPQKVHICISISCRISKLKLSQDAMDTWGLQKNEYLILLISFEKGYVPYTSLKEGDFEIRVCQGKAYRPKTLLDVNMILSSGRSTCGNIMPTFVSRPLDYLIRTRLLALIKHRLENKTIWGAAEIGLQSQFDQGTTNDFMDTFMMERSRSSSAIVAGDVIADRDYDQEDLPFPLVAMQFALRRFTRCPDYCLVCHRYLNSGFDSLKPYVCDRPLCLYQGISLGLGTSLEHEILAAPQVVDLLTSFCYLGSQGPDGLDLKVPPPYVSRGRTGVLGDLDRRKMIFMPKEGRGLSTLRRGDWVVLDPTQNSLAKPWHCRVIQNDGTVSGITLTAPIAQSTYNDRGSTTAIVAGVLSRSRSGREQMTLSPYKTDYDALRTSDKLPTMRELLGLLPTVSEMANYLETTDGSLNSWVDRICPATLTTLRWIVASNRSCIVSLEHLKTKDDGLQWFDVKEGLQRMPNMAGWMQFRFAQGAPDKEWRFNEAINAHAGSKVHPTIFAWHGSPITNWHTIVREGLNYDVITHGRSYGHGIYHANDFHTSKEYVGSGRSNIGLGPTEFSEWPGSDLNITCAIALSEIVNCPEKFISASPYYVIDQADWIQTRFLLVGCRAYGFCRSEVENNGPFWPQDEKYHPKGPTGQLIDIPESAIPRDRKRRRSLALRTENLISLSDDELETSESGDEKDNLSVDTTPEDRARLLSPRPEAEELLDGISQVVTTDSSLLPFKPRPLSSLPLLAAPSYATSSASRALQREFRLLLETHEEALKSGQMQSLGWYFHHEIMEETNNLYQWIVSLHSFPLDLPLAKDLFEADLDSIVLELRFNADYPMSPPFIRVVRPRMLSFSQGGGGHVTIGGSICMDLLTSSGWSAANTIESVLLQVRVAMMSVDPIPARLANHVSRADSRDYGAREAFEAYIRVSQTHGWEVPKNLQLMM